MKRLVAASVCAILLALSVGPAAADGPATFADAQKLAAEQNKPLLIDFYATW